MRPYCVCTDRWQQLIIIKMDFKTNLIILLLLISNVIYSQTNEEIAYAKALEAIELMNSGKFDESIILLRESEKLDSSNYIYPYEIALAYTYKKEYEEAIKILEDVLENKSNYYEIFQLLGNNYSMNGDPVTALEVYERGLKLHPNSGNLYLEIGNIHLMRKNYSEAVLNYKKGVEVAPEYPSNYYRLAKLYLNSTDKLQGLIYGELFMNIERTTERTQEMSELLFEVYKESITFSGDSSRIDFCEILIDASSLTEDEIKLPLCAIFGKNFILSIIGHDTITLKSLSEIRARFIEYYVENDLANYPNVLFEYHQKMKEAGVFTSYNNYLFQIAEPEEYERWLNENGEEFEKFVEWYTSPENILNIETEEIIQILKE